MDERSSIKLSQRDLRLDFWRGLCIVDMVLIHMLEVGLRTDSLTRTILYDYVRFAAGGFVFMAGVCVGAIHLRKIHNAAGRRKVYLGLLRRSGFVLCVHYLAEFSYLLLCPLRGERLDLIYNFRQIVLLRQGYDLLPFYVLMLALCPLLLELMRRGFWWIVAAASFIAFAIGSRYPWADDLRFPITQHFLPLLWQMIFVLGLFGGALLPRFDRLNHLAKARIAAGSWIGLILLLAIRDQWLGISIPLNFAKVPLSLGEALRYVLSTLAIITTTDLFWRWIEPLRFRSFINRLGRRSLGTFVLHIWIVGWVVKLSLLFPATQIFAIAFMIATVGLLWLIAGAMDDFSKAWSQRYLWMPRMEYSMLPALIGCIALILIMVNPFVPPGYPFKTPSNNESVMFGDEVADQATMDQQALTEAEFDRTQSSAMMPSPQ